MRSSRERTLGGGLASPDNVKKSLISIQVRELLKGRQGVLSPCRATLDKPLERKNTVMM